MPAVAPRLVAVALLALFALSAPALAQDEPAPAAQPAPETNGSERKVSEKALTALKAWSKAMHLPSQTAADVIVAEAAARHTTMFEGGTLGVKTTWKRHGGIELDVTLPKEMTDRMQPQMLAMLEGGFRMWSREALAPAFESPEQYARDYHVGERREGARDTVELLPCTESAGTERQVLYFDEAGLCERRVFVLRVDPSDPSQAMMVGAEIEASFTYEKVGERHVVKRMELLLPFGDIAVEYGYYDVTDGPPLLKSLSMTTPFGPDPIEVTLSDYTLDGNLVAATKKPAEGDTSEPAEKAGKAGKAADDAGGSEEPVGDDGEQGGR